MYHFLRVDYNIDLNLFSKIFPYSFCVFVVSACDTSLETLNFFYCKLIFLWNVMLHWTFASYSCTYMGKYLFATWNKIYKCLSHRTDLWFWIFVLISHQTLLPYNLLQLRLLNVLYLNCIVFYHRLFKARLTFLTCSFV